MSALGHLPLPHRIAGFALTASLFVLLLLGLARHNLRGDILQSPSVPAAPSSALRSQSHLASEQPAGGDEAAALGPIDPPANGGAKMTDQPYYVFLQKFPLKGSWIKVYHTEVIVCPRATFAADPHFLNTLDSLLDTLAPSRFEESAAQPDATKSPFAVIAKNQWRMQSNPGCVQLGYGGANCGSGCCGSPHKQGNRNYPLSSTTAVISNADGTEKELYLYGISGSAGGAGGISGEDAYRAVCHGHMNAVEMGKLPMCVSNWAGRDYNPLTNNCNTYTSTVLKCVYGLSDAKPGLGVSDLRTVTCPTEKGGSGVEVSQCAIPTFEDVLGDEIEAVIS